jgi:hypothetical protein
MAADFARAAPYWELYVDDVLTFAERLNSVRATSESRKDSAEEER